MNFSEQVFDYCERQGPALNAEPLNVLSNLAFFFWAWRLWVHASRQEGASLGPRLRCLAGLIALVGAGSMTFHITATRWASILDVLFIGVFNICYLFIFLRVVAQWRGQWAAAGVAVFVLADRIAAANLPGDALNGSVLYLPAVIALVTLTAYALALAPESGRMMAGALAVFAVSLLARTLDHALCPSWAWGTHFLWHLLNAWVLFQLSRALIPAQNLRPQRARAGHRAAHR